MDKVGDVHFTKVRGFPEITFYKMCILVNHLSRKDVKVELFTRKPSANINNLKIYKCNLAPSAAPFPPYLSYP